MPIISFVNPKGGAGKTTCALILATELAQQGASVIIVDADPESWIVQWFEKSEGLENISVVRDTNEETILDTIEAASGKAQFVIVDLEGTASMLAVTAITMTDHIIIPIRGSFMDGKSAGKAIGMIKNTEKMVRREIPYTLVFNSVSAAIQTRAHRNIAEQLSNAKLPVLDVSIVERAAYRDMPDYGGTLYSMDPKRVRNLDKAQANANSYMKAVLARIKDTATAAGKAA